MKVFLEMDSGPGAHERYELSPHGCRAIGRQSEGFGAETVTITDRPMKEEGYAIINSHCERRQERCAAARPDEPRNGAFRRGADILLDDELTSRTHAMVFLDEEGPSLVDLGSTNGTFVNAMAVTDADLEDGDVIEIGSARFVVHVEVGYR